jgi:hypothetical protein
MVTLSRKSSNLCDKCNILLMFLFYLAKLSCLNVKTRAQIEDLYKSVGVRKIMMIL